MTLHSKDCEVDFLNSIHKDLTVRTKLLFWQHTVPHFKQIFFQTYFPFAKFYFFWLFCILFDNIGHNFSATIIWYILLQLLNFQIDNDYNTNNRNWLFWQASFFLEDIEKDFGPNFHSIYGVEFNFKKKNIECSLIKLNNFFFYNFVFKNFTKA